MKYSSALLLSMLTATPVLAEDPVSLGTFTVTGTKEKVSIDETPATVGVVSAEEIEEVRPTHPSEVAGRVPGVHVNVTGGEGHMTAIRQPISTSPVYLYLEDGIPTRSTGFFNHNALYEVNLPQSGGMEVFKGPGTALYGSDAIGGVINVLTKAPPQEQENQLSVDGSTRGYRRLLISSGNSWEDDAVRVDLNLTDDEGWRDATEYNRQSGTVRWDKFLNNGAVVKTVATFSEIDQQTAGSSRLTEEDYLNNPTTNYTPISFRDVTAFRLSSAYELESADSLISVTPYFRHNEMELLPNWSLSYDPVVYTTQNDSLGLLLKYRKDVTEGTQIIVGADLDYSPGSREEHKINATKDGSIFTSYELDELIYDYDVTFTGMSPYVHLQQTLVDDLELTAGLRYDVMSYDYDNKLGVDQTDPKHRRPADTKKTFHHTSPKVGLTYAINDHTSTFLSYRHAFRVPSESQLFRQGKAVNTVDLEPVKVDSYETGIRGQMVESVGYELSVYYMTKKDDILSFRGPGGETETVNAGETEHKGVEVALNWAINNELTLHSAYAYSEHYYDEWQPNATTDYSGNEMESAPRIVTTNWVDYRPHFLNGGNMELEWTKLGSYWMDAANTHRYKGHDLYNYRINVPVNAALSLHGKLVNITDERYATAASYKAPAFGRPGVLEFAPGLPRTLYVGVDYVF